jgi:hypothetical protein
MAGGYVEEVEADFAVGESQPGLFERGVHEHHQHPSEEAPLLHWYVANLRLRVEVDTMGAIA